MNEIPQYKNLFKLHPDVSHGSKEYPFQIHESYCAEGFSLYPHIHDEFEFLYILQGNGIVYVDGKEYILTEHQGIFINSNCVHLGRKMDDQATTFFSIVFSPLFLGKPMYDIITEKYINPVINRTLVFPEFFDNSLSWHKEVSVTALKLYDLSKLNTCTELKTKSLLFHMWNILCANGIYDDHVKSSKSLEQLRQGIDFITENYQNKITLTDIADHVHLSVGHFSRLFSEFMKCSPIEYLIHIRLQNSCEQLKKSDLPIGTIALDCGFHDFSYYSKKFREEMGCSPKEYRKK